MASVLLEAAGIELRARRRAFYPRPTNRLVGQLPISLTGSRKVPKQRWKSLISSFILAVMRNS